MVRTLADRDLDDSDRQLLADIDEFGWHVVQITEENGVPGWAFSVGFQHTLNHPEVIVFGLPLDLMHFVINEVGEQVRAGATFGDGSPGDGLLEGVSCMFRRVAHKWHPPFLGYAQWYYQKAIFSVLQCIWPDKSQQFPWEPDFKREWLSAQPLLFHDDVDDSRTSSWLTSMNLDAADY